jgi:hypothetical protein
LIVDVRRRQNLDLIIDFFDAFNPLHRIIGVAFQRRAIRCSTGRGPPCSALGPARFPRNDHPRICALQFSGMGAYTYQWDAEGKMVSACGSANSQCASGLAACYTINALGQRVEEDMNGANTQFETLFDLNSTGNLLPILGRNNVMSSGFGVSSCLGGAGALGEETPHATKSVS